MILSYFLLFNLILVFLVTGSFARDFLVERQLGPSTLLLRYAVPNIPSSSQSMIHASNYHQFGTFYAGMHCLGKGSTTVALDIPNHGNAVGHTGGQAEDLRQEVVLTELKGLTGCLKVSEAFARRMGDLFSDRMPYFYAKHDLARSSMLIWPLEESDLALLQDEKHALYDGSGSVAVQVGGTTYTMALSNAALDWLKVLLFEKRLRLSVQLSGRLATASLMMHKKDGQTRVSFNGREVAMLGLLKEDELVIYTVDTQHPPDGLNDAGHCVGTPIGSRLKKEVLRDDGMIRAVQMIMAPHFPWFFHLSPPPLPKHASPSHQLSANHAFYDLKADDPLLYWRHVEKSVHGELWQLGFRAVSPQAVHDEEGRLLVDSHINMHACASGQIGMGGQGERPVGCDSAGIKRASQPEHMSGTG
jgi:hypothetical protein